MNYGNQKVISILESENLDFLLCSSKDSLLNTDSELDMVSSLTGFSSSNAFILFGYKSCYVLTDGRYISSAQDYFNSKSDVIIDLQTTSLKDFLDQPIFNKKRIGFDSRYFSYNDIVNLDIEGKNMHSCEVGVVSKNSFTEIGLSEKYIESSAKEKIANISAIVKKTEKSYDGFILTDYTLVSWILNIRDINKENFGAFCSFYLYVDCNNDYIVIKDIFDKELLINIIKDKKIIIYNSIFLSYCNVSLFKKHSNIILKENYLKFLIDKSIKSYTEIKGFEKANIEESIVLIRFSIWLENIFKQGTEITEIDICNKINEFRAKSIIYIKNSFPTIAGFKENSALIHYNPAKAKNPKAINSSGILLVDTGAHYEYGTTDITRMFFIGDINECKQEVKENYTLVLKGMISVSMSIFTKEEGNAIKLDKLSRFYLNENLKDYPHSTGHGIGCCLSVHEGPYGISSYSKLALKESIILSNEPGYYEKNNYGIRIENNLLSCGINNGPELYFKTLTKFPINTDLIQKSKLSETEKKWLNEYHSDIYFCLKGYLNDQEKQWLYNKTKAIT